MAKIILADWRPDIVAIMVDGSQPKFYVGKYLGNLPVDVAKINVTPVSKNFVAVHRLECQLRLPKLNSLSDTTIIGYRGYDGFIMFLNEYGHLFAAKKESWLTYFHHFLSDVLHFSEADNYEVFLSVTKVIYNLLASQANAVWDEWDRLRACLELSAAASSSE